MLKKYKFLCKEYCTSNFNMIEFYSWKIEYIRKKMNYLVKRNNRFKGIFLYIKEENVANRSISNYLWTYKWDS